MSGSKSHSSGLKCLLHFLLLASTVVSDDGPFTVSPPMPSICTASTVTYSSALLMPTGSFDIDPGSYGMGNLGQNWTFAVTSGIELLDWGDDGQNISKWVVENGNGPYVTAANPVIQYGAMSYTFTVPTDGSWPGGMMTGLAASSGGSADFTLTITALLPCHLPVAMECGSNSDPAFDTSQWEAWSVDHFLSSYYTNYTNGAFGSPGSFMDTFYNDFTDGEGSVYDQCNVTDTPINDCNWIGSCRNLATSGRPDLTPYQVPAYLTMYAMRNFMALLNNIYTALQWANADMERIYEGLGSIFVNIPSGVSETWYKAFPLVNTILTLIAVIFIALEFPFFVAALIGTAAAFGFGGDAGALTAAEVQTDFQLEQIWTDSAIGESLVTTISDSIYNLSNAVWLGGANVTEFMKGGSFLTAQTSLAETNATNRNGPPLQATEYFENQFISALINSYYKANYAYIVYIPYGQVQQLDCSNSWGDFTQDICQKDWIEKGRHDFSTSWNDSVVASCMDNGMAVLYSAFSGAQVNSQPQSFFVKNFSVNDITYNPVYMIESSVNGFLAHGFNYNATDAWVSQISNPNGETVLNENTAGAIMDVQQWTAGMYNLPVCVQNNLASVPNSLFQSQYGLAWPAQIQPCQCMSDSANITIDGITSYFRDNIPQQAAEYLSDDGKSGNWCPFKGPMGKACDSSQGPGY